MFNIKTVGKVDYLYRLVHRWVSEKTLNVQSEFLQLIKVDISSVHYIKL